MSSAPKCSSLSSSTSTSPLSSPPTSPGSQRSQAIQLFYFDSENTVVSPYQTPSFSPPVSPKPFPLRIQSDFECLVSSPLISMKFETTEETSEHIIEGGTPVGWEEYDQVAIFTLNSPYVDLNDYGSKVFVIGSNPEIGNWCVLDDARLWQEDDTQWSLDIRFEKVHEGQFIYYKYAILTDDGQVRIENLEEPRKIVLGPYQEEAEAVRVVDEWEVNQKTDAELEVVREQEEVLKRKIVKERANHFIGLRKQILDQSSPRGPQVYHNDVGLEPAEESKSLANHLLKKLRRRSNSSPFLSFNKYETNGGGHPNSNPNPNSNSSPATLLFSEKKVAIPSPEQSRLTSSNLFAPGTSSPQMSILKDHFKREGRLDINTAREITERVIKIISNEPNLLYLRAPIVLIGDIHGQYYDTIEMLDQLKRKLCEPPSATYLFLGDYVDRGCFSTEVLFTLFSLKIAFPKRVFILRGNHECRMLSAYYNFKKECLYKYDSELFDLIAQAFKYLPLAAVINSQYYGNYFAVHGGISPNGKTLTEINAVHRFSDIGRGGPLCDLMWSDPIDFAETEKMDSKELASWLDTTYKSNMDRGCSFFYGLKAIETFLLTNKLMGIIRAHEPKAEGFYQHYFGLPLVEDEEAAHYLKAPIVTTIFSAPNFCDVHHNKASVLLFEDHPFNLTTSLSPSSPYFNLFIYGPCEHPYVLPDFQNAVSYTINFVTENLAKLFLFLMKTTDGKNNEEEDKAFYEMLQTHIEQNQTEMNEAKKQKNMLKMLTESNPDYLCLDSALRKELFLEKVPRSKRRNSI
eukprot:TRINITY_DN1195_c0_g1_i1.p1 TRINITY_DN1195_c0_g1~~TRINITY_DN1195_c0_g1_i1.p1  ORF type:complete len:904 (-),score=198.77 TRINITY_DN1195_c0_g1_i1:202-2598(-)